MNQPLVSVVVPVYQAENYILACLESIVKQSYTALEVIVVDDGSPDCSAELAREFAQKDERIRVVSQENQGVSAARNYGIREARGEYITFVDADDYLASDFVAYMLKLVRETGADFCLSENWFTRNGQKQIETDAVSTLSSSEAIALLLSPKVIVGSCNKIFRLPFLRENALTFSTDLFYGEGLQFIIQAAYHASKVGVGKRYVYYYRRNNESSATSKFRIEKMRNGERALDLIEERIPIKGSKAETMYLLHRCLFSLGAMTKTINCRCKNYYEDDYQRWKRYLRYNTPRLLMSRDVSLYRKALLAGGCLCPRLMAMLDRARRKSISDHSV